MLSLSPRPICVPFPGFFLRNNEFSREREKYDGWEESEEGIIDLERELMTTFVCVGASNGGR